MLYIMHVDWNWIKQRPHFIAEELNKYFNLYICTPVSRNRKALSKNEKIASTFIKYIKNPLRKYNKAFYLINNITLKMYYAVLISIIKPIYIYLTFPEMIEYIPGNYKGRIIYDCMDDCIELQTNENFKKLLFYSEYKLVHRADAIICSSEYLSLKTQKRYNADSSKFIIVNNAYDGGIIDNEEKKASLPGEPYRICYVGTVSGWFDYELLAESLRNFNNIEYHIIGPADTKYASDNRIKFYGTVNHEELYAAVKDFDCFIMPFKINELIRSVNPVKLYEYINFNKPVIYS